MNAYSEWYLSILLYEDNSSAGDMGAARYTNKWAPAAGSLYIKYRTKEVSALLVEGLFSYLYLLGKMMFFGPFCGPLHSFLSGAA